MARFAPLHLLLSLLFAAVLFHSGCVRSNKNEKQGHESSSPVKIVLDPGHGGQDGGASPNGAIPEKKIVLDIALQVERFLRGKGLRVVLTRRSDKFIPLWKRAQIANERRAALFVSIHANSCTHRDVDGLEIYYAGNQWEHESLKAAAFIQRSLKTATGARDRGIRKHPYAVLSRAKCPSVLVEVGYLSNRREATLLARPSYRKSVAGGIARGIVAYARTRR